MKILQLCTKVPYPPKDGGAAGVYSFSRALAQLGHSVDVLAVNPPKHFVSKEKINEVSHLINIQTVEFETAPVISKALFNLMKRSKSFHIERFVSKRYAHALLRMLEANQYDVVQVEGVYLCPYIGLIRKHSKAKVILRAHNIEYALWHDITINEKHILKHFWLGEQTRRLRKYEIEQFNLADAVTSVTASDCKLIKSFCPDCKAEVFPFGIEPILDFEEQAIDLNSIFFLGALDWIPNQEAILWFASVAWPAILHKFPAMHLHIAGRNAPKHIESKFESKTGIVYHGEVPRADEFMKPYTIMIVPLFSGSGIRVKILEAMQQGKVVIASAKAASGIPAEDGKHILIADTSTQYIEHLQHLNSNPALAREISQNARAFVRDNFDILAITKDLVNFYNSI